MATPTKFRYQATFLDGTRAQVNSTRDYTAAYRVHTPGTQPEQITGFARTPELARKAARRIPLDYKAPGVEIEVQEWLDVDLALDKPRNR